jgi:hypothetical protein
LRNYIENSDEENNMERTSRYGRRERRKVVYVDEGGIGEVDARFDNTKQMGMESMERERMELHGNQLDRQLEEREFMKVKRGVMKSKDEFMMREHVLRQSRNESEFNYISNLRIFQGTEPNGHGRVNE